MGEAVRQPACADNRGPIDHSLLIPLHKVRQDPLDEVQAECL
jgi:hypothetical protein